VILEYKTRTSERQTNNESVQFRFLCRGAAILLRDKQTTSQCNFVFFAGAPPSCSPAPPTRLMGTTGRRTPSFPRVNGTSEERRVGHVNSALKRDRKTLYLYVACGGKERTIVNRRGKRVCCETKTCAAAEMFWREVFHQRMNYFFCSVSLIFQLKAARPPPLKSVVLNLFFSTPPMRSKCPLFQDPTDFKQVVKANVFVGEFIEKTFHVEKRVRARSPPGEA